MKATTINVATISVCMNAHNFVDNCGELISAMVFTDVLLMLIGCECVLSSSICILRKEKPNFISDLHNSDNPPGANNHFASQ